MLFNTVLWAIIVRAFFLYIKPDVQATVHVRVGGGGGEVNKIFPKIQIVNPRGGPGKGGGVRVTERALNSFSE